MSYGWHLDRFSTQNRNQELYISRINFKLSEKNDLTVNDYIAKLTMMAEESREVGVTNNEGDLSLISLNGLDSLYDSFVTSKTSKVENTTLAELLELLRVYEAQLH